ncbi:MAG: hypothetical protein K2L80_03405, partial [Muribaculaceae bacterium]|nr:hypothetical protein [Muribaculaceae bacterium]
DEQRDALKLAIDDIFRYPFLSSTKLALGRMLSARKTQEEIVEYVLELRRVGDLCNIPREELDENRDPSIICSLGLKSEQ